jgi:hypothetical protein
MEGSRQSRPTEVEYRVSIRDRSKPLAKRFSAARMEARLGAQLEGYNRLRLIPVMEANRSLGSLSRSITGAKASSRMAEVKISKPSSLAQATMAVRENFGSRRMVQPYYLSSPA